MDAENRITGFPSVLAEEPLEAALALVARYGPASYMGAEPSHAMSEVEQKAYEGALLFLAAVFRREARLARGARRPRARGTRPANGGYPPAVTPMGAAGEEG